MINFIETFWLLSYDHSLCIVGYAMIKICKFSNHVIFELQARFTCLRCAACGCCVSTELPSWRLWILEKQYVAFLFSTKYPELSFVNNN